MSAHENPAPTLQDIAKLPDFAAWRAHPVTVELLKRLEATNGKNASELVLVSKLSHVGHAREREAFLAGVVMGMNKVAAAVDGKPRAGLVGEGAK